MDSNIVDKWIVTEEAIAMETSVVDGDKFVTVQRMITIGDGASEMAVIPLARGDELDRLIVALQRARGGGGLGESATAVQPETTTAVLNSLLVSRVSSTIALSLSNVVEGARRLLLVEGRTLSIGIIVLILFFLFLGGR